VVARRGGGGLLADFFSPSSWEAKVVSRLCKGALAAAAAAPLPFAVESAESADQSGAAARAGAESKVVFISYYAAAEDDGEEEEAREVPAHALAAAAANRGNAAWGMFGDDDDDEDPAAAAAAPAANVGSPSYWEEILAGAGLRCDGGSATSAPLINLNDTLQPITPSQAGAIAGEGYVWGGTVVPARETEALAEGMRRLVAAGWPPVCIFTCDLAWLVVDRLWAHAEAMLGGDGEEVVLEPSLAAFKLEAASDAAGKRYVGNNFGQPHRDYTYADVHGSDDTSEAPGVVSVWLPLVDVTLANGCMYVVPKSADEGRGGRLEASAAVTPKFDRKGVRALAPAGAGTLLAWAGNTIHWGTGCSKEAAANPRMSLAFVFRKMTATCDPRGPPLTRAECRAGLPLKRRLEVVRHAMTCFEHWYGSTAETRAKLAVGGEAPTRRGLASGASKGK
jgi:hypothetical protein